MINKLDLAPIPPQLCFQLDYCTTICRYIKLYFPLYPVCASVLCFSSISGTQKVCCWSCILSYAILSYPVIDHLSYPIYCNVAVLPVFMASKDLPISPRFSPTSYYRDACSELFHLVNQGLNFYFFAFSRFLFRYTV